MSRTLENQQHQLTMPEPSQSQVVPPPYDTNGVGVIAIVHTPQFRQKLIW
jgi:hypothetical protein